MKIRKTKQELRRKFVSLNESIIKCQCLLVSPPLSASQHPVTFTSPSQPKENLPVVICGHSSFPQCLHITHQRAYPFLSYTSYSVTHSLPLLKQLGDFCKSLLSIPTQASFSHYYNAKTSSPH